MQLQQQTACSFYCDNMRTLESLLTHTVASYKICLVFVQSIQQFRVNIQKFVTHELAINAFGKQNSVEKQRSNWLDEAVDRLIVFQVESKIMLKQVKNSFNTNSKRLRVLLLA